MILIFSEIDDPTTIAVIDWLRAFGSEAFILQPAKKYVVSNLLIHNSCEINFVLNEVGPKPKKIEYSKIDAVWIWRGGLNVQRFLPLNNLELDSSSKFLYPLIKRFLQGEIRILQDFIYFLLSIKPSLTTDYTTRVNKLTVLEIANRVGLKIPVTTVISKRQELVSFLKSYPKVITKSLGELFNISYHNEHFTAFTEIVNNDDLLQLNSQFEPILVQEYIDKHFELRIFYLDGEFFAMKIYSQGNKQTEIDFRKYDLKNPNRTEPYVLNKSIQDKLRKLMKAMEINFGSIDVIVSRKNEYVFLEVNPVGQFGMVSAPCNYFLEKRIAQHLINLRYDKEKVKGIL